MKQLTTFLFFYLCSLHLFGQYETVWGKQLSSTNSVRVNQTVLDNFGNSYTIGLFKGTMDLDPGAGVQSVTSATVDGDLFIQKMNTNGGFVWGKTLPLNESITFRVGIAVDNAGNVYATSAFSGTIDFDPGPGVSNLTQQSASQDAFILKLNSAGNFVWVKRIAAPSSIYFGALGHKLHIDNSGNLLLIGSFGSTVDFDPGPGVFNLSVGSLSGFIAKYDNNGNFLAVKEFINASALQNITQGTDGNIIVSGFINSTIDCDPSASVYNLTPVGTTDGVIIKLTPTIDFIWAGQISGPNSDYVKDVFVDNVGDLFVTGIFTGTTDFDFGTGSSNMTVSGSSEMFVCKYNSSGNLIWKKQTNSTNSAFGSSVLQDNAGFVYALGDYRDLTNFGVNPSDTLNSFVPGKSCVYLSKYDPSGNFISTIRIGGTSSASGYFLDLDPITGNLILVGEFNGGIIDVDVQQGFTNFTAPTSVTNAFFVKLQPACLLSSSSLNISHCSTYTVPSGHETYTLSGMYTDTIPNAAGCDSIITINLTISDGIAPVADLASLSNVTSQCSVTSLIAPTATDNCAGTITGTHNATLPITIQGTTVVTWTYNDGHGNTSTQTQNVIIIDNTAPVANLANLPSVTGQCSITSLTAPTATDNCAGAITGTHNATLPITTPGTTLVTWTYNDGHGNSSTQTQNVFISVPVATTTLSGLTITATTSGATYQWINCGTGNTPIAGATAQSFTASANGTYAVIVTQNGCSATSDCVTISTVGLEEISHSVFTVYPNPNTGVFKVVTGSPLTIRITNASGQEVSMNELNAGENTIELTNIESGIYFISASDSNGQISVERISIIK